jgi:cyclic dehypoxanthinyl futalosine synthase
MVSTIDDLREKAIAGERFTAEEGKRLFTYPNLPDLSSMATAARQFRLPETTATYSAVLRARWAETNSETERLRFFKEAGGTEILLGGEAPADWSRDAILRRIESLATAGGCGVTGLNVSEIARLADSNAASGISETLKALQSAGLVGFTLEGDIESDELLLNEAKELSMIVNARLRLSPDADPDDRLEAILKWRGLQERTGAISVVTPLNVSPDEETVGSAFDYLRLAAITRLLAENILHVRASLETHGLKIAQMALEYGADDFGEVTLPNPGLTPGDPLEIPIAELERNIGETGFRPQCRNARYEERPRPEVPLPSQPIALNLG